MTRACHFPNLTYYKISFRVNSVGLKETARLDFGKDFEERIYPVFVALDIRFFGFGGSGGGFDDFIRLNEFTCVSKGPKAVVREQDPFSITVRSSSVKLVSNVNELSGDLLCNIFPVANTWNRSSTFPFFDEANVVVVVAVVAVIVFIIVIIVVVVVAVVIVIDAVTVVVVVIVVIVVIIVVVIFVVVGGVVVAVVAAAVTAAAVVVVVVAVVVIF